VWRAKRVHEDAKRVINLSFANGLTQEHVERSY
jgi:hypothetical protein